jgi:hypothetical protein
MSAERRDIQETLAEALRTALRLDDPGLIESALREAGLTTQGGNLSDGRIKVTYWVTRRAKSKAKRQTKTPKGSAGDEDRHAPAPRVTKKKTAKRGAA